MKTAIIRIGNSRGVRIPKAILEQCNFGDEVELEVQGQQLTLKPVTQVRSGWSSAFKEMAEHQDDQLIAFPENQWDEREWEWK